MAKSDSTFKIVAEVGVFGVIAWLVLRYVLPGLSQALNTAGTGFFGPNTSAQGALPFGFTYRTPNSQFSTSGNATSLLQQLVNALKGQPAQPQPPKPPAGGGGGSGHGASLPNQGLGGGPVGGGGGGNLTLLQDWMNAGNQDLSTYFANNPWTYDAAYYDTPGLENILIPDPGYTPELLDLSGAATPIYPTLAGSDNSTYDPSLDNIFLDSVGGGGGYGGGDFNAGGSEQDDYQAYW